MFRVKANRLAYARDTNFWRGPVMQETTQNRYPEIPQMLSSLSRTSVSVWLHGRSPNYRDELELAEAADHHDTTQPTLQ